MHRWHELLAEGDYGRPSETSARLVWLADKGPDAGIHVVAWADGYATAERALYRDTEWPVEQVEKFKPYSTASLYAFAREGFQITSGKWSPA